MKLFPLVFQKREINLVFDFQTIKAKNNGFEILFIGGDFVIVFSETNTVFHTVLSP